MSQQAMSTPSPGLGGQPCHPPGEAAAKPTDSVCAIVVAFFPDAGLMARIRGLLLQVTQVVIVDNTPDDGSGLSLEESFHDTAQLHLIENRANLGISTALNQGLAHAMQAGCKWILTLDQDTECYPDMVDTLLQVANACQSNAAVIGGNYLDPRNEKCFVPINGPEDFLEQTTVITSGCLVDAGVAAAIGGFRDDYFIDQVDHEFCLRMRAQGHKVIISRKPVMNHSVGHPGGARLPLLGVLPNHPPVRKYYIARNTVVMVADYWRREPRWCLRRLVRLLLGLGLTALLEEQRLSKVRAFAAGVADGLRRRLGPCSRASIHDARPDTP
jgi:rhamnosyltransferase